MSCMSAPNTTPFVRAASSPTRIASRWARPAIPGPGFGVRVEVDVPGARHRRGVHRRDLGDGPPHLEGVADGREEPVVGERELQDVVGARVDARRDLVEGAAVHGIGEDDDRHGLVGRIRPDAPAGLANVARGGPDPDQHRLRLADHDGRDRRVAMADRPDVVARPFERQRQRRVATRLTLDDKDQSTAGFVHEHVYGEWRAGEARI